jgi:two-component system, OmpR family, sensor histidine kinase TctE
MRWRIRFPPKDSLLGFLSLWILGGVWAIALLVSGGQYLALLEQGGRHQDEYLLRVLAQAGPDATSYRASDPKDEHVVAGTLAIEAYPWPQKLTVLDAPELYVSQVGGVLVRAIVVLREDTSSLHSGKPTRLFVQMAAPWADRIPSLAQLVSSVFSFQCFLWFSLGVTLMIASGLVVARQWLERSQQKLDLTLAGNVPWQGEPQEFRMLIARARDMHQVQQKWMDGQKRFLDNASHQLRTPMAVLRNQIQSALAEDVPIKDVLPQMLETTQRATHLIEQLLSLSKVEQFKRTGELNPIDLHAAAKSVAMDLSPLIAAKRLNFSLEGQGVHVPADPLLLSELLKNLLTNAIHHTPRNGRLGIDLRNSEAQRGLVIWDEGPGIDDGLQDRLFQPFVASAGGTGLGLSICLQMAQVMGAHVRLFNRVKEGKTVGVDAVVSWN